MFHGVIQKNNTGTVFLRHGVEALQRMVLLCCAHLMRRWITQRSSSLISTALKVNWTPRSFRRQGPRLRQTYNRSRPVGLPIT